MNMYDIITKKKLNQQLTHEEIEYVIKNYTEGNLPDYQVSALLMAIWFNGLNNDERFHLTKYMAESGDMLDNSKHGGKVDKHSSGGVGDKTTLVVGPMVAACGLKVAKMSGRGLGHTGGTLDKLESIPGFQIAIPEEEYIKNIKEVGISIVSQTGNLAPADKKLYALRDVTATVDELSLIAASIMSKKLASGAEGIVLDVKAGTGAFMRNLDDAIKLAEAMVDIGEKYGRKMVAVVTDMNQPLGRTVGNSIEVLEAIQTLKNEGPQDLLELSLVLGSYMLILGGKADTIKEARQMLTEVVENGKALDVFRKMVKAQNGDPRVADEPESILPISKNVFEYKIQEDGYFEWIDTEKVGLASMVLGAGRAKKEDDIDPSVGIEIFIKTGDRVFKDQTLAKIYYRNDKDIENSLKYLKLAYSIKAYPIDKNPLVYKVIGDYHEEG
jgi:pyrimidine-nucleoside phosphorylase